MEYKIGDVVRIRSGQCGDGVRIPDGFADKLLVIKSVVNGKFKYLCEIPKECRLKFGDNGACHFSENEIESAIEVDERE